MHRRPLLRSTPVHSRMYACGVVTPDNLPSNLDELIEVLRSLSELPRLERIRLVRALDNRVRAILAEVGDEDIYQLTRDTRQVEVARLLGVSTSRVNNAISRYHKHRGVSLPPGRPSKA